MTLEKLTKLMSHYQEDELIIEMMDIYGIVNNYYISKIDTTIQGEFKIRLNINKIYEVKL